MKKTWPMMKVRMNKKSKSLSRGLKEGYRSGLEETLAQYLKDKGVDYQYEPFKLHYKKPETDHTYLPDFYLQKYDIYIETKGRFTKEDRQKHLLIKEQLPGIDLRFVFTNPNNKLYKGSKTTYSDWCKKHGFKYSKQTVPWRWICDHKEWKYEGTTPNDTAYSCRSCGKWKFE